IVEGELTLKMLPLPVALDVAVPPITSVVSAVIWNMFEFIVIPVTTPVPLFAVPTLNALNPQLLKVFPEIVTVVIDVSGGIGVAVATSTKSVIKATWLPPEKSTVLLLKIRSERSDNSLDQITADPPEALVVIVLWLTSDAVTS